MKCPVCGQEAKAHIFHCVQCDAYVHEKCWKQHMDTAHKENKS